MNLRQESDLGDFIAPVHLRPLTMNSLASPNGDTAVHVMPNVTAAVTLVEALMPGCERPCKFSKMYRIKACTTIVLGCSLDMLHSIDPSARGSGTECNRGGVLDPKFPPSGPFACADAISSRLIGPVF